MFRHIEPWTYEERQNCQEIFSRVLLGPQNSSKDLSLLQRLRVTDIILVRSPSGIETTMLRPRFEELRYHIIEMEDNAVVSSQRLFSSFVTQVNSLLAAEGVRVLVIGASGMNRSAALVAAAVIATHRLATDDAIEYLVGRRRCVAISAALMRQLKEFEVTSTAETATGTTRSKRNREQSDTIHC